MKPSGSASTINQLILKQLDCIKDLHLSWFKLFLSSDAFESFLLIFNIYSAYSLLVCLSTTESVLD